VGAITRSCDHGLEGVAQREILEHIREAGTTGRHLVFRKVLNVEMAKRNCSAQRGGEAPQKGIDPDARSLPGMDRTGQHDETYEYNAETLGNAKGTGF
jgi:hypothetical protein